MSEKKPKILVVGAGAVGGVSAGLLARAGHDLRVAVRNEETADAIRKFGLHIFGKKGDLRVYPPVLADLKKAPEKMDLVLLATKATALPGVALDLVPWLHQDTALVSLQNGMAAELIADHLGVNVVIGCVVGWGATRHEAGELEMTSSGEFVIGRLDGHSNPRLEMVRQILQNIVPTRISGNIRGDLYGKLIINSCITTLGAICGLTLGRMLAMRKARTLFIAVIREAMAVAEAMELRVESLTRLDFYSFLKGEKWMADLKRHALIRLIGLKYRRLKSSSLQSLERGQPTEIDFLNGYVAAQGRKCGIPTPLNDFLIAMVKEIEAGLREITPVNFSEKCFDRFR